MRSLRSGSGWMGRIASVYRTQTVQRQYPAVFCPSTTELLQARDAGGEIGMGGKEIAGFGRYPLHRVDDEQVLGGIADTRKRFGCRLEFGQGGDQPIGVARELHRRGIGEILPLT